MIIILNFFLPQLKTKIPKWSAPHFLQRPDLTLVYYTNIVDSLVALSHTPSSRRQSKTAAAIQNNATTPTHTHTHCHLKCVRIKFTNLHSLGRTRAHTIYSRVTPTRMT